MENTLLGLREAIGGILGISNSYRRLCEQHLEEMKKQPEVLVLGFLKLLQVSESADHKKLSATLLKRYVSVFNPQDNLWNSLSKDTQTSLKEQLLTTIISELDYKVARLICLVVAEVAGTIQSCGEGWEELDIFMYKLATEGTTIQREMGYLLMNYVFGYVQDKYEQHATELTTMFAVTLSKDELPVKIACINALSSLLIGIAASRVDSFTSLLPSIASTIEQTFNAGNEDSLKSLLESLNAVADTNPKYFIKGFDQIFHITLQLSLKICESFDDSKIPQIALEMLVTIMEKMALVVKGKDYFTPLIKILMLIMRLIPSDIDAEWMQPTFISILEEEEEDNVTFGKRELDRLLSCITEEDTALNLMGTILMEYFSNESDWRFKYAGLVAASGVGEYIEDVSKISMLLPILVTHISHSHPKIRHASIDCLGQVACDYENEFAKMYGDKVIPSLITALNDPIPRVQRTCCNSLQNILNHMEMIESYLPILMINLEKVLKNSESFVQESAISLIGTIAQLAPDQFKANYYNAIMPFLIQVLQQCKEYKYKRLRGHTIECITEIAVAVGKEVFKVHIESVIKLLYHIQENELEVQDPQRLFLISAWQKLCVLLKQELIPYVEFLHSNP